MLKLSKYELRKNRNTLLLLLAGLAILQAWFLISLALKKESSLMGSVGILSLYGVVCYFAVFLFAVTNYYREINSRTSYLVFMTPVSPLRVVLSKMLTVLLIGIILAVLLSAIAMTDLQLLTGYYDEYKDLSRMINDALRQFGIHTGEILFNLLFGLVTFLLSFYSTVTLIYLCITLSATLLQNSRFKMVLSIVLFFAGSFLLSKLQDKLGDLFPVQAAETISVSDLLYQSLPYTIFNLAVILLCVSVTSWLLKRKLSL